MENGSLLIVQSKHIMVEFSLSLSLPRSLAASLLCVHVDCFTQIYEPWLKLDDEKRVAAANLEVKH